MIIVKIRVLGLKKSIGIISSFNWSRLALDSFDIRFNKLIKNFGLWNAHS